MSIGKLSVRKRACEFATTDHLPPCARLASPTGQKENLYVYLPYMHLISKSKKTSGEDLAPPPVRVAAFSMILLYTPPLSSHTYPNFCAPHLASHTVRPLTRLDIDYFPPPSLPPSRPTRSRWPRATRPQSPSRLSFWRGCWTP